MSARGARSQWPTATTLAAAVALMVVACSGPVPTPVPSSGPIGPAPGATPAPGTTSGPGSPLGTAGPGASFAPLPAPTVTDGTAIGQALRDPKRAAEGVSSLLAQLGIGIYRTDGSVVRRGLEKGPRDLWLFDGEVNGLIEMAEVDAAAIAAGRAPASLADLHRMVGPLLPDLSEDDLLLAYEDAYGDSTTSVVAGVMSGRAFEPSTPVTRVELWLLLVDGFVPPLASATAGVRSVSRLLAAAGPGPAVPRAVAAPRPQLPALPSVGGIDPRDFALLAAHLPVLAWQIPFEVRSSAGQVHEGHGGPGPLVEFSAVHRPYLTPLQSPFTGLPLLMPTGWQGAGLSVQWSAASEAILNKHGSVLSPLVLPIQTGPDGASRLRYQVKSENGNQQVPEAAEAVTVTAKASARDLVSHNYVITPSMLPFLIGDRQGLAVLTIAWHPKAGWLIDETFAGGRIHGLKCGDPPGEWIMDGTYDQSGMHGVQRWTITIDANGTTGTYTYTDSAQGRPGGAPATVTLEGKAGGTATLTMGNDGRAVIRLKEEFHRFQSWVDPRYKGSDQDAPLIDRTVTWVVGGAC